MNDNKAEDLARKAIDTAAGGDEAKARKLAEQAKKMDPNAAAEVGAEADQERQDASSYQERQKTDG